jgi:hypothetical protein
LQRARGSEAIADAISIDGAAACPQSRPPVFLVAFADRDIVVMVRRRVESWSSFRDRCARTRV